MKLFVRRYVSSDSLYFNTRKMRQTCLLFLFVLLVMPLTSELSAQEASYIQGWSKTGESATFIDVFSCVMQCPGEDAKIYVQLFNEGAGDQDANLTVHIADLVGNATDHVISQYPLELGEMAFAKCGGSEYLDLIFPVPDGIAPIEVSVSVTFN